MPHRPDRQVFVSVAWLAEHLHDDKLRMIDARYVAPTAPRDDAETMRARLPEQPA